ncbi:MAG TPA: NifB/NifX family molybdenum-iron cluster-binding protein [Anaerolineaceae bacterium]|nr:NifB/NifX family molybdenum-iron cluster-binding protein [Anaerolineaceae bacterium]
MPRPIRLKTIRDWPQALAFTASDEQNPEDKPSITLNLEEWECLRLVDYQGMDQDEAAKSLDVSRQLLQMLLRSARQKVARALVEVLPLYIRDGHYTYTDAVGEEKIIRSEEMKVAVTCFQDEVFAHFGRTPEFAIYQVEDGKIIKEERMAAPAEGHSALAGFLKTQNVTALICGGIGGGAINALRSAGIEVFTGASGKVREQAESLLAGQLPQLGEANCDHSGHEHSHEAGCGHHDHNC